ncbi:MAG: hypothetical protein Q9M21_00735, partial [Mariprofundaceae bacterium]|nr:hypothetical protein [Mariprofundaceae bacterium]
MKTLKLAWLMPCLLCMAMPIHAAENDEIQILKAQIKLLLQRVEALESKQQAAVDKDIVSSNDMPQQRTSQPSTTSMTVPQVATTTAENTGNPSLSVV